MVWHQPRQVLIDVSTGLDALPEFYSAESGHIVLKRNRTVNLVPTTYNLVQIGGLNMPQISTNPGHSRYPFFSKLRQAASNALSEAA